MTASYWSKCLYSWSMSMSHCSANKKHHRSISQGSHRSIPYRARWPQSRCSHLPGPCWTHAQKKGLVFLNPYNGKMIYRGFSMTYAYGSTLLMPNWHVLIQYKIHGLNTPSKKSWISGVRTNLALKIKQLHHRHTSQYSTATNPLFKNLVITMYIYIFIIILSQNISRYIKIYQGST